MTAEVAIMNKRSIVLAADTLMSFSGDHRGSRDREQKIFALSDTQPVAAMIYNRPNVHGMDMGGQIIPQFVREHGEEQHRTIEDWSACFMDFVERCCRPYDHDVLHNTHTFIESVLTDIEQTALDLTFKYSRIERDPDAATDYIREENLLAAVELLLIDATIDGPILHVGRDGGLASWIRDNGIGHGRQWLQGRKMKATVGKLLDARYAGRVSSGNDCGVVIAGYGSQQLAPALAATTIEGRVGPTFKCVRRSTIDMATRPHGTVEPFAQGEMVESFLDGMSFELKEDVQRLQMKRTHDALTDLSVRHGIEIPAKVFDEVLTTACSTFVRDMGLVQTLSRRHVVSPLVSIMNVHDMEDFARALISSSIARHRFRLDAPTVGGAVDVAVMTRSSRGAGLHLSPRRRDEAQAA